MIEDHRDARFHDLQTKSEEELRRMRMHLQQSPGTTESPSATEIEELLALIDDELKRRNS